MNVELPSSLKPIGHLVKIAKEYASRDVVIYFWSLYRAVQEGMKLDKSSSEALNFLTEALSTLEQIKKDNPSVEALTEEIVAQAHVEDQAQRLFNYAEAQDKNGVFNINVVKAFYTSGYLFDVLSVFGNPDENILSARKYSKWRATYIHNCLKTGQTPVPGNQSILETNNTNSSISNLTQDINRFNFNNENNEISTNNINNYFPDITHSNLSNNFLPTAPSYNESVATNDNNFSTKNFNYSNQNINYNTQLYNEKKNLPSQQQQQQQTYQNFSSTSQDVLPAQNLKLEDFSEARRFTKYALSALDYDDAKTAIENLYKALKILQKN